MSSLLYDGLRSANRAEQAAPKDPHDASIDEKNVADRQSSSETESESEVAAALGIEEKRLVRKLDWHLLPGVCVL
jgi:hypothetical protein